MERKKSNVCAIVGFILAIVSVIINLWGIVGIAALVLSIVGIVKSGTIGSGKGLSIAGIIIGALSIVYAFAVQLLFL